MWPPIHCKQFDGEEADAYRRRAAKVREIITNFRQGRYDTETGEVMERKLIELQTPSSEHNQ